MWPLALAGGGTLLLTLAARKAALKAMDIVQYLPPAPVGMIRVVAGAKGGKPRPMLLASIGRSKLWNYRNRGQYLALKPYFAWNKMARAAKKEGVDLQSQLTNSFRTWLHQRRLHSEGASTAAAGFSEHQRGTAVDINTKPESGGAAVQTWLEQNAHRYGWQRTYWARWHWEYKG